MAIRDVFDNIFLQLKELRAQQQGRTKTHPTLIQGKIVRLFNHDGFGFIQTADGEEYYFNSGHVVSPSFDVLRVGMEVHFLEAIGDDGLQAHRVSVSKKKRLAA